MLVTPVMFCTHLSISLSLSLTLTPYFCAYKQMATNYTTLNINIHTVEGFWGTLHYSAETVTDNALKTFLSREMEKNFFLSSFHDRHEKLNPHRMCVTVKVPVSIYSLHFPYR